MKTLKKIKQINWSVITIAVTIVISMSIISMVFSDNNSYSSSKVEQNSTDNDSEVGACGCGNNSTVNSKDLEYKKATVENNYQIVEIEVQSSSFGAIIVQKDIPVKFNLKVKQNILNGCNNAIIIPKFNIEKDLKEGNNVVEFTPSETGEFQYSCWMRMLKSYIVVVDDINNIDESMYKIIN